jgi:hypothetical protein
MARTQSRLSTEYFARRLAEARWRKKLEYVLAGAAVVFLTAIIAGVI